MISSRTVTLASCVLLLTACGGGSSNGGTSTSTSSSGTSTSSSGTSTSSSGTSSSGGVSITTQPTSQAVAVGVAASFSVVASGTAPTYQWYKNGTAISGATTSSYSPPAPAATDSGAAFTVTVNNASNAPVTSAAAVLYVKNSLSLIAGKLGGVGHANGAVATASFYEPTGVASDASGNVFVADQLNHLIREITAAGTVVTIAGISGTPGAANGSGCATATFNAPSGVAVDASGNVFVADAGNNTIRKITTPAVPASCAVSTFATGFLAPASVAVDASGNVYVADTGNQVIRKVTSGGVVSTLAGNQGVAGSADGTGAAATFSNPQGVAVDASFNVYVADTFNSTIRKVTSGGVVTTIAGSPGNFSFADGTGAAALFNAPTGVAVDSSGILYVADSSNFAIRKVVLAGNVVTTLAGNPNLLGDVNATGGQATFALPVDVTVDSLGNLYVADADNSLIRKVVVSSAVVSTLAGSNSRGYADGTGVAAQFSDPHNIAVDSAGNIYVADRYNNVIRKITAGGVVTTFVGSPGVAGFADGTGAAATFNQPFGMAFDSLGNLYVADSNNDTIRKVTPAGVVTTFAGSANNPGYVNATGTAARFNVPYDLAVDAADNLYLTDYGNNVIRKITPAAVVTLLAGVDSPNGGGYADGSAATAMFFGPHGIGVNTVTGDVFVADRFNDAIRLIKAGVVSTVAGTALTPGLQDGTGAAALFNNPGSLSVDSSTGNIYITDYQNNAVRVMTPSFAVSTLSGNGTAGTVLGSLPGVLSGPSSIVFEASTTPHLVVADSLEHSIVLITLP